jgi:hypothetical protein
MQERLARAVDLVHQSHQLQVPSNNTLLFEHTSVHLAWKGEQTGRRKSWPPGICTRCAPAACLDSGYGPGFVMTESVGNALRRASFNLRHAKMDRSTERRALE